MKDENLRLDGNAVFLRYPKVGDFDVLSALYASSAGRFPEFIQSSYERESFDNLLADVTSEAIEPFIICKRDTTVVGTITLSQIFRRGFQNAYLGYMLGAEHTGHGYMTEAVKLTLKFAFGALMLHRVEANVQPENLASIAVLERTGFTKEGFSRKYLMIAGKWRDHERWAIIKEDWKER